MNSQISTADLRIHDWLIRSVAKHNESSTGSKADIPWDELFNDSVKLFNRELLAFEDIDSAASLKRKWKNKRDYFNAKLRTYKNQWKDLIELDEVAGKELDRRMFFTIGGPVPEPYVHLPTSNDPDPLAGSSDEASLTKPSTSSLDAEMSKVIQEEVLSYFFRQLSKHPRLFSGPRLSTEECRNLWMTVFRRLDHRFRDNRDIVRLMGLDSTVAMKNNFKTKKDYFFKLLKEEGYRPGDNLENLAKTARKGLDRRLFFLIGGPVVSTEDSDSEEDALVDRLGEIQDEAQRMHKVAMKSRPWTKPRKIKRENECVEPSKRIKVEPGESSDIRSLGSDDLLFESIRLKFKTLPPEIQKQIRKDHIFPLLQALSEFD